ncbi:DUF4198 domain-containing protein [Hymenobacter aerilatus]|uniref:DUF4198 domain-containing protein n=1 Tax=Hymenobacter aerilatus TaxID=2932251 RepID=A0A8T9T247_9BACT|nr:DUF4198 domain-containing protein [Hymenobacter aerilatus]UOR06069.1 DUF4198 domain-containing protein [Hymenobacter aerilatus]
MRLALKSTVLTILISTPALLAAAHEFWLAPPQYVVTVGQKVRLQTWVGENFTGQRWVGKSNRLTRFVHAGPAGIEDLTPAATQTDTLQTALTFTQPGTHVVALTTNDAYLEQTAEEFNTYLKEEGLDKVLVLRQQRNELSKSAREAYQRCAKTLVQAGKPNSRDTARAYARPLGLPLELVPEQNPYLLRPGAVLTVRVEQAGQPVAGALVQVWQHPPGQKPKASRFYSNLSGRILLRLSTPGSYLLSTVQMAASPDHARADWHSTWASLTFGTVGTTSY